MPRIYTSANDPLDFCWACMPDEQLTRNHHGAGFWDGDYPEHGEKLTAIADSFGEVWLYVGDNGLLYFA